jgi:hypothetical protein
MWSSLPSAKHRNRPKRLLFSVFLLALGCAIGAIWNIAPVAHSQQPMVADDSNRPQIAPIPARPSPQETATLLIHTALRQAVWGPSVTCKIRQRISLLDKQLVGSGVYTHAGKGSCQLKMHVRMVAGDQINSLIQVSDGRVMSTQENIGPIAQRSRINLNRIMESLGPVTSASLEDPVIAMYLAVGGQAELLRKLAQQYKWTQVQSGRLGEIEVWWISGELTTEPSTVRALAEVDQLLLRPSRSGLIPSTVRIALAKKGPIPYWLYQVEQARDESLSSIKSPTRLSMLLEFTEPNVVDQLPAELFQSQSGGETIIDETRRYLPPGPVTARIPTKTLR